MFTLIMLKAHSFKENILCRYIEYKPATLKSLIIKRSRNLIHVLNSLMNSLTKLGCGNNVS